MARISYVDPAKVSPEFVDQVQGVLPSEPPSVSSVDPASHTATFQSVAGTATAAMPPPKP